MTMKMFGVFSSIYATGRLSDRSIGVVYNRRTGNVFVVLRPRWHYPVDFFWMIPDDNKFMPTLNVGNMKFSEGGALSEILNNGAICEIIVVPDGEEDYSELKGNQTSGKSLCI